jgi:hypothetical protein
VEVSGMAGRRRVTVELGELVPGEVFLLAGFSEDFRTFELVEQTGSSSFVREIRHTEQIEFTRSDGRDVAFGAMRKPPESFSSGTRVVVL